MSIRGRIQFTARASGALRISREFLDPFDFKTHTVWQNLAFSHGRHPRVFMKIAELAFSTVEARASPSPARPRRRRQRAAIQSASQPLASASGKLGRRALRRQLERGGGAGMSREHRPRLFTRAFCNSRSWHLENDGAEPGSSEAATSRCPR